ncbi:MAG: hypothetical protein ACREK8_02930 [Gemmatimonadales bacterium]
MWQAYFQSKGGDLAGNAGTSSTLWVPDEQAKWPLYDLAGFYVPAGALPEVVNIRMIHGTATPAYEITVRFSSAVATGTPGSGRTVLAATWIVERRAGRWLLANTLPRRTQTWHRERVGQIQYFVEPSLTFNRARAVAAVQFIDSLAAAFGVARLRSLDYYVAPTVDAVLKALGVRRPPQSVDRR